MKIKIKRINKDIEFPQLIKKGEWIDLRASQTVNLTAPQAGTLKKHTVNGEIVNHRDVAFDSTLIPLGVAMEIPKGFEAILAPRSSSYKKYGIIQTNSFGVIDNSYSSDSDEWLMPVLSTKDTVINKGDRICQFRIQLSQKATFKQKLKWFFSNNIKLVAVKSLNNTKRGGFGSTGVK